MTVPKKFLSITVGCALYALGFSLFLEPASLAAGGISGVAVLITHFLKDTDGGTVIFLLNLPLLSVGVAVFGLRFFFWTIYATAAFSGMISIIENFTLAVSFLSALSDDPFLCAIAGGVLTGFGMAMIFHCHATTGGTDIIVKLIRLKLPSIKEGYIFLIADSAVVIASGIVFRDISTAIYSGLALVANSLTLNAALYGVSNRSKRE